MRNLLSLFLILLSVVSPLTAQRRLLLPDGSALTNASLPQCAPLSVSRQGAAASRIAPSAPLPRELDVPVRGLINDLPDGEAAFYAFQTFGPVPSFAALSRSATNNVQSRDVLYDFGFNNSGELYYSSGTMVGDEYWAYVSKIWLGGMLETPYALCSIDLETGEIKDTKAYYDDREANCTFVELSYDPSTDYLYALQRLSTGQWGLQSTGKMNVLRMRPSEPENAELLGVIPYMFTMAVDNNVMYFVRGNYETDGDGGFVLDPDGRVIPKDCSLLRLDLADVTPGALAPVEVGVIDGGALKIDYFQTMEFDHTTHTLWWANVRSDAGSSLCRLDVNSARTSDSRPFPSTVQYLALGIPYQTAAPKAPSHPVGLAYSVAAAGEPAVTFTWINPAKDYDLGTLAELSGVKVYRDGTLHRTLTEGMQPGTAASWTDTDVPSGRHTYKFVPFNAAGDGLFKEKEMFVGRDVPGEVLSLKAVGTDCTARLSWQAPATGRNGGWYDPATLTYTVVRMPDGVTVADGLKTTSFEDEVTAFRGYTYIVTAVTADGKGASATSDVVAVGPAVDVPYINLLESDRAGELRIIDRNGDGTTWAFFKGASNSLGYNNYCYSYSRNPADDYLLLPPLKLEKGKQYEVRFVVAGSTYDDCVEKFSITQSTDRNATDRHAVKSFELPFMEGGKWQSFSALLTDPSKGNNLGLHVHSDADQGFLMLREIIVREYSTRDLSVTAFKGNTSGNVNTASTYAVTVRNEGYAAATDGRVELYDSLTNRVLATAETGEIPAGKACEVKLVWTPDRVGDYALKARVVLEGDTYPLDNLSAKTILVTVMAEDGSRALTIGEYETVSYRPLYHKQGFSRNEIIYFADEIGQKKVSFTGMEFTYNHGENTSEVVIPVKVWMAGTDLTETPDNDEDDFVVDESLYQLVFDGTLTLSGTEDNAPATMTFDTPFSYDGGKNLLVRVETDGLRTPANVDWHVFNCGDEWMMVGPFRNWYTNRRGQKGYSTGYVPVTKFYYDLPEGISDLTFFDEAIQLFGRTLRFGGLHERIEVVDAPGRLVRTVQGAREVVLPASGVYMVKVTDGLRTVTHKVLVK